MQSFGHLSSRKGLLPRWQPRLNRRFLLLEQYLFLQMLNPILLGVAGGTLLMTAGKLFTLADRLVVDRVNPWVVLQLLLLDIPATMVLAMPIAGMFATMLTLGKLSTSSEITAMRAGGISFRRIFFPILLAGLVMSITSFGLSNLVVPATKHRIRLLDQRALLTQTTQVQNQDVFFKANDTLWFFIRSVNPQVNTMQDVTILEFEASPPALGEASPPPNSQPKNPQLIRVTQATEAIWSRSDQQWRMRNGVVHEYASDGTSTAEIPFTESLLEVSEDLAALMQPPVSPGELSLLDLTHRIQSLTKSNLRTQELQTEWHSRFSVPLASLFAVLMALPLSVQASRQVGRYGGVVVGILLVFVYYLILNLARSLGEAGAVLPWMAAWSHSIIFGGLGVILVLRYLR